MDIEQLRLKHKTRLVEHACRCFGIHAPTDAKQKWIDQLLAGGDLQQMLDDLRGKKADALPTVQVATTRQSPPSLCNEGLSLHAQRIYRRLLVAAGHTTAELS